MVDAITRSANILEPAPGAHMLNSAATAQKLHPGTSEKGCNINYYCFPSRLFLILVGKFN
jgi:hypothetical protein